MTQAVPTTLTFRTFEEFIEWYPDGRGRYELIEGVVVEMNPTGDHEEVAAFLNRKLNVEIDRLNLPYFIPRTYLVKPPRDEFWDNTDSPRLGYLSAPVERHVVKGCPCYPEKLLPNSISGYQPDVLVLDRGTLEAEPLWKKSATITLGSSVKVAVEVVSTNWGDDYGRKLTDYELLGIPEYWIVDYRALGARRYIGSPKQPTLSIYTLVEGEYQVQQFKSSDQLQSAIFSGLNLTAEQIFQAGVPGRANSS